MPGRHGPRLVRPLYGSVLGAGACGRHLRVHAPPPTACKGGADQDPCADPPDEPPERGGAAQDRCGDGEGNQTSKYPDCPVKEQVLPEGSPAHPRPLLTKQQPPPDRSSAHPARSLSCMIRRLDQTKPLSSRRRRSALSSAILDESSAPAADTRSLAQLALTITIDRARYVPDRTNNRGGPRSLADSASRSPQVDEAAGGRRAAPQTSQADSPLLTRARSSGSQRGEPLLTDSAGQPTTAAEHLRW